MSGDKTKLVALERLDLEDAQSFQDLPYNYMDQALGGLLGYGMGALSPFKTTLTTVGLSYFMQIGSFVFYHSERGLTDDAGVTYKTWNGRILAHDPTDPNNVPTNSKINYTSAKGAAEAAVAGAGLVHFTTAGAFPFIWARPIYVDEDSDARRQWNVGAGQEAPITMETRQRVRIEFSLGTSNTAPPAADGGYLWAAVGKIVEWTGALGALVPRVQVIPAWDDAEAWANTVESGTYYDDGQNDNLGPVANVSLGTIVDSLGSGAAIPGGGFQGFGADRSIGLIQLLHTMRDVIRRMGGTSTNWFLPPTSLEAVANDLSLVTAESAALVLQNTDNITIAGVLEWNGAILYAMDRPLPTGWTFTVSRVSAGYVSLTATATPWPVELVGVNANPYFGDADARAYIHTASLPGNVANFRVYRLTFDGGGAATGGVTDTDASFQFALHFKKTGV